MKGFLTKGHSMTHVGAWIRVRTGSGHMIPMVTRQKVELSAQESQNSGFPESPKWRPGFRGSIPTIALADKRRVNCGEVNPEV